MRDARVKHLTLCLTLHEPAVPNPVSQSRKTVATANSLHINILPLDRVGYGKIEETCHSVNHNVKETGLEVSFLMTLQFSHNNHFGLLYSCLVS